jgi:YegS/Rv2252/BmrU family lipid kinase
MPNLASSERVAPQDSDPLAGRRRILVIYNPVAGWRSQRRYRAVLAALERLGCPVTVRETRRRGDAEALAAQATGAEFDVVAVAGGDGTVNEVVNGLKPPAPPLGIIPLGTANALALEIGLGTDAEHIARTLAECPPVPIHVGRVDGRRFVMMVGVGFDAHVVAGLRPGLKRWAGKGAYYWQILVELMRYPFPTFTVTADGEVHAAAAVVVANGHYYGGRFVCAPHARLDEPRLEVCLFERGGRWNALRYVAALAAGRLARLQDVRLVYAGRVAVEGPSGDPVQVDGDILARLPASIEVAGERIQILAPALAGASARARAVAADEPARGADPKSLTQKVTDSWPIERLRSGLDAGGRS